MPEPGKRSYDATSRRARAEEERAETRRRVVEAAHRLFLEKGYVATTMADIRKEAGVAIQSVYNAGRSKAELLHLVTDVAVGGDDEPLLVEDRPFVTAISEETDPDRQVELLAGAITTIAERIAPVFVAYREAAAVDASAAEELEAQFQRRRETLGRIIRLLPASALRASYEESTDAVWAISSIDAYLLLTRVGGWSHADFARWLPPTLKVVLLRPSAPPIRSTKQGKTR